MTAFEEACSILANARGKSHGVTIANLAAAIGLSRRETEQLLEECLPLFPFVLVAGATGYYQPTTPDELNSYVHSLHSRHRRMQIREATVKRQARRHGWKQDPDGRFVDPPKQQELPL